MCNQQCFCWCSVAKAPGHQYLQCWLNIMYRPISHLPQGIRQIFQNAQFFFTCAHLLQNGALWYGALWDICLVNCGICEMGLLDLLYKSHNTPVPYPSIAPFCNRNVHISGTKCCIVGYMPDALWDLWDGSLKLHFERLHFEMFKDKAPSLMEVPLTSECISGPAEVDCLLRYELHYFL